MKETEAYKAANRMKIQDGVSPGRNTEATTSLGSAGPHRAMNERKTYEGGEPKAKHADHSFPWFCGACGEDCAELWKLGNEGQEGDEKM